MSNDLTVPIDWPIVKPGESLYTGNDWGTIPSDLIDSIEPPTPYRFSKRKFHRLVSQLAETLQFGNLSIYRLDLLLAEKYHDLDYSVFMDCVKRFTERVKTKHEYADGLAMIQRVVEYGESRGYHLHMLVCYRWRACKNPHVRVNALINEWKRCCEHLEDFRYVLSKQPLIYPEGFWYTLDHGSDYHWYDSGEGSRPHPLLYAVFWLKSRLEALSSQHVKLKLYTAKVPGSLHLSTDEDWDVFTERLKAASTYDGFIAKYHFVERD